MHTLLAVRVGYTDKVGQDLIPELLRKELNENPQTVVRFSRVTYQESEDMKQLVVLKTHHRVLDIMMKLNLSPVRSEHLSQGAKNILADEELTDSCSVRAWITDMLSLMQYPMFHGSEVMSMVIDFCENREQVVISIPYPEGQDLKSVRDHCVSLVRSEGHALSEDDLMCYDEAVNLEEVAFAHFLSSILTVFEERQKMLQRVSCPLCSDRHLISVV